MTAYLRFYLENLQESEFRKCRDKFLLCVHTEVPSVLYELFHELLTVTVYNRLLTAYLFKNCKDLAIV